MIYLLVANVFIWSIILGYIFFLNKENKKIKKIIDNLK